MKTAGSLATERTSVVCVICKILLVYYSLSINIVHYLQILKYLIIELCLDGLNPRSLFPYREQRT